MLRTDGREHDDVAHAGGGDRRGYALRAAIVVDANLARTEYGREENVRALRARQGALERAAILDVSDGHVSALGFPCLALRGAAHDDADGLSLSQQRTRCDAPRISRSTQHDEHWSASSALRRSRRLEGELASATSMFPMDAVHHAHQRGSCLRLRSE